jgi:alcohol dehydrogenase (NADP+)
MLTCICPRSSTWTVQLRYLFASQCSEVLSRGRATPDLTFFSLCFQQGDRSQGGYANYNRSPAHFAVKIPDGLDPAVAAPMLCGGVTVYSPLKQYGAGPGKDVGIIGLGGLGHFGVLFAAAMGANVTVISHSNSKEADAKKMGAKRFIATHDDDKVFTKEGNKRSLDLIICTTNDPAVTLIQACLFVMNFS